MKFNITVNPGPHTTELDLARQRENIRTALIHAVADISIELFPEYEFGGVDDADIETDDEQDERLADEAYAAQLSRPPSAATAHPAEPGRKP